jgi:hypothetical protein
VGAEHLGCEKIWGVFLYVRAPPVGGKGWVPVSTISPALGTISVDPRRRLSKLRMGLSSCEQGAYWSVVTTWQGEERNGSTADGNAYLSEIPADATRSVMRGVAASMSASATPAGTR